MKTIVTLNQRNLRETNLVDFDIGSFETDICIHIEEAMVCNILTTSNDKPPLNKDVEGVEQMEGVVSFHELEDESIGVLLSIKEAGSWLGGDVIQEGSGQMMAMKTMFGWTL
jgi:hypothetical protein